MDIKDLKTLLNSFYEGETNKEEELVLYNFFSSGDIPEDMIPDKNIFLHLYSEHSISVPTELEQKLNILIDHLEADEGNSPIVRTLESPKSFKSWKWAISIAASVLIMLSIGIYSILDKTNTNNHSLADTYSNPKDAYIETQKALLLVSNKLNEGIDQAQKANDILY